MKICLINNLYKPYSRGGAEKIVEIIANSLKEKHNDVFILSTKPMFANHKPQTTNHKIYYINALYYNLNRLPKLLRIFWHVIDMLDLGSYLKIKFILKKEQPDIVMTHNLKGVGYLIPRLIKKLKIQHFHTLHDVQLLHPSGLIIYGQEKQIDSILAKIYTSVCAWLFDSPNIVISPSNWLMQIHTSRKFFSDSKQIILPSPTIPNYHKNNLKNIPPSAEEACLPDKQKPERIFKFLYVGQIEKHKGILFLTNVFQKLCDDLKKNNCQLAIVGDGSKLKPAKKLASNNKNIKFLGKIGNDGIKRIMAFSDCLIVPSLCYENSPTVIYEAASIGLPVIASRLGGIPELIHELGGILFEPTNEGDLMYQMKWVIEHPKNLQKISRKEKENIKNFSSSGYVDKLIKSIK